MSKIHLVIQGCGDIAKKHARTLKSFQDLCTISFSSRDGKKSEEYRKKFGGLKSFSSLEKALVDSSVDGVLLCTPHQTHAPLGMQVLQSGKKLIVEKPLALSVEEGKRLVDFARSQNIYMNVAENYHYRPALLKLEEWIQGGVLGKIQYVRINKLHQRKTAPTGWRLEKESMGAGIFIDGGIHWVNVLDRKSVV